MKINVKKQLAYRDAVMRGASEEELVKLRKEVLLEHSNNTFVNIGRIV